MTRSMVVDRFSHFYFVKTVQTCQGKLLVCTRRIRWRTDGRTDNTFLPKCHLNARIMLLKVISTFYPKG